MPKVRTKYVCSNCNWQGPAPMGRCPNCKEFGTVEAVVEEVRKSSAKAKQNRQPIGTNRAQPQKLKDVDMREHDRLYVPMQEFSRVLGGGLVPGSILLLGGEPGSGKSTIMIQVASLLANEHGTVLYVSGEESSRQIKMRAERLGIHADDLYLLTETNLGNIFEHVNQLDPVVLIVDSIQTTYSEELDSSPGLVSQVRECASRLQGLAKSAGVTVFMIGHVTKEGNIAGPRVLEHIVDTVMYLEGDLLQQFRLLRTVKNRFGATSEVGVFEMVGSGMIEVPNPSEAFLAERVVNAPGSAIAVTMEGTRPLLVEVQALTNPTAFGNARRTSNGIDYNRLLLLTAVLGKRMGMRLFEQDIFVNVVGGLKIDEPASDLGTAIAIASSYYEKSLPADMAFIGEIGLSGEIRTVNQLGMRLNEASKIGFKRVMIPKMRRKIDDIPPKLKLIEVRNIADAFRAAMPDD
ncbi:MAG: DNA repair protein RadA [Anaerolineae bacterium]|nr:DNA repair protein RadA [Anaerolineae bacterium]